MGNGIVIRLYGSDRPFSTAFLGAVGCIFGTFDETIGGNDNDTALTGHCIFDMKFVFSG
jgi:hypothetical protein